MRKLSWNLFSKLVSCTKVPLKGLYIPNKKEKKREGNRCRATKSSSVKAGENYLMLDRGKKIATEISCIS